MKSRVLKSACLLYLLGSLGTPRASLAELPDCDGLASPTVLMSDSFDGSHIAVNESGTGNGFWLEYPSPAGANETGGAFPLTPDDKNFGISAVRSLDIFQLKGTKPLRTTWDLGPVSVTNDGESGIEYGTPGAPGTQNMDFRYMLGLVSANFPLAGLPWIAELFKMGYQDEAKKEDDAYGGLYVVLNYERNSGDNDLSATGYVRSVNLNHPQRSDREDSPGLKTLASFTFNSYDGKTPIEVSIVTNDEGWRVCFNTEVDIAQGNLTGSWGDPSLAELALTREFDRGARVFAQGQHMKDGRGTGSLEMVLVEETTVNAKPPVLDPPLDCNGVAGGVSVKDRCGICDGDGLSCGQCREVDVSLNAVSFLESTEMLKQILISNVRLLRERARKGERPRLRRVRRINKRVKRKASSVADTILINLNQLPASATICENTDSCEIRDLSAIIRGIEEGIHTLSRLARIPLRIIKREVSSQRNPIRRRLRKIRESINLIQGDLVTRTTELPGETITCVRNGGR